VSSGYVVSAFTPRRCSGCPERSRRAGGHYVLSVPSSGLVFEKEPDLHDAGHVHACLPRELPPEAERELIEQVYNPASFLTYTNPQTPRALQIEAVVRF